MIDISTARSPGNPAFVPGMDTEFLTFTIAGQMFGIPVLKVRDVLKHRALTRIPLAPPEIAGALNLRGRIITAIDVRRRLRLPLREDGRSAMSIVVEQGGDVYNLIVDSVGEVLRLPTSKFEPAPPTLDARWREVSEGIFQLDGSLLVILNADRLLSIDAFTK